jgi:hypothetical protein
MTNGGIIIKYTIYGFVTEKSAIMTATNVVKIAIKNVSQSEANSLPDRGRRRNSGEAAAATTNMMA